MISAAEVFTGAQLAAAAAQARNDNQEKRIFLMNSINLALGETVDVDANQYVTLIANSGTMVISRLGLGLGDPMFQVNPFGTLRLGRPDMTGNITIQGAGGVWAPIISVSTLSDLIMNADVTLTGNDRAAGMGGAVEVIGNFVMNGGNINNNTTTGWGGGVAVQFGASFTMTGGNINNNDASLEGGGVGNNSTFTMSGGSITGNTALTGGGIHNNGTFTMNGGTVNSNNAPNGGGVRNTSFSTFNMSGGIISGHNLTAGSPSGGGVYNEGVFNMSGGAISGNILTPGSSSGGGVRNAVTGIFTMSGGAINTNSVVAGGSSGGGVHNDGIFNMSGGAINTNSADTGSSSGGGVYISATGTFRIEAGTIHGNTAANGTAIYNNGGTALHGASPGDPIPGGFFVGNARNADVTVPGNL